jgi:hypothetical protein
MSAHTSGPWQFREYSLSDEMLAEARAAGIEPIRFINNDGSVPITANDSRICVVDCQAEFKRNTGHRAECAERDANARLIAAAPDLLAALKKCLNFIENVDANFGTKISAADDARAAIAKAEGRT